MPFKWVILWTDAALFALLAALGWYAWHVVRTPSLRATWGKVARDPASACAAVILVGCSSVAFVDSVHFRRALPAAPGVAAGQPVFYGTRTESLLDVLLRRQLAMRETTYSAPLAAEGHTLQTVTVDGVPVRRHPRLVHGGAHLHDASLRGADLRHRGLTGLAVAALGWMALATAASAWHARRSGTSWAEGARSVAAGHTHLPVRAVLLTVAALAMVAGPAVAWMDLYHVLGTDRTGNDVLVQALKSIRTAFVIGGLSTLATLPLAVGLGIMAGYFRGWVDEVIQYVYTVLSSIPNTLLIAACVLMVQVFIDQHPDLFQTGVERADVRLALLCLVLGLTGWATLARLLRAETLKLKELEFVQAARSFGVGHGQVMRRHILPNVVHLILITTVLDFSALVLYEAVLSYVGVGVDPSMHSYGGMINMARGEMGRDPVVWWSFSAAFVFMVTLVLAANLLADGVRDAFDPRAARRLGVPRRRFGSRSA